MENSKTYIYKPKLLSSIYCLIMTGFVTIATYPNSMPHRKGSWLAFLICGSLTLLFAFRIFDNLYGGKTVKMNTTDIVVKEKVIPYKSITNVKSQALKLLMFVTLDAILHIHYKDQNLKKKRIAVVRSSFASREEYDEFVAKLLAYVALVRKERAKY